MRRGLGSPLRLIGMRARAWAVASAAGIAVASWPALANGAPFELAWSAPTGCPSREEIVDATLARLGESRSEAAPELFVHGTVRTVSGGFVVTLALKDASGHALGERDVRVEQKSCDAVSDPASLVLAMMIAVALPRGEEHNDAVARPRAEAPAASQKPPATPPASVGARENPPASPAPPASSPSAAPPPARLLVGAAGIASLGILPTAGAGAALRAMYAPRSTVLVGLEASFEAGSSVRIGAIGDAHVGFQLFSAGARVGLPVLRTDRFELIPTLGARGGLLHTSPNGFPVVENETRATMLAGAGLLVRAKLGQHLFAEALPEVEAVLVRDRLLIRDGDKLYRVFRASPIEARLALGLGYEFP